MDCEEELIELLDELVEEIEFEDLFHYAMHAIIPSWLAEIDFDQKILRKIKNVTKKCVNEYGEDPVVGMVREYFEDDEEEDEFEEEEIEVPDIQKIRAFNLPKMMICPNCDDRIGMSGLIQQAVAYHFIHLFDLTGTICYECEVEDDYHHHDLLIKCPHCHDAEFYFILEHKDTSDPRKSWFIRLHSTSIGVLTTKYDHEIEGVKEREFIVSIDIEKRPHINTIESMRDPTPYAETPLIECDEEIHYYIADLNKGFMQSGPIYCPGCNAFSSETSINRRKQDYQQSKHKCFHDVLEIINQSREITELCPRCKSKP
ncbi:MAG: hypothetical protein INQ03_10730 [Candidatus Heimdallarchaeota archaeon]|nr:hypothetical protein [Candidatus Heimdallarchaeota archaeon]